MVHDDGRTLVLARPATYDYKDFVLDHVLDPNAGQHEMYDQIGRPVVDAVLQGYHGTILAYGQTGTGKSYTMFGRERDGDVHEQGVGSVITLDEAGVLPIAIHHIFDHVNSCSDQDFRIYVSCAEIYMETIIDLLDLSKTQLAIREDPKYGVYVDSLTQVSVSDPKDALYLVCQCAHNRRKAATNMNQISSRSHVVIMITVEQTPRMTSPGGTYVRRAVLTVVDLAGSERVAKSGSEGRRLDEAKIINKSLSALGNCVCALSDPNATHIPFRDSKLTRLLSASLGGNSKTCLVANIGPSVTNFDESVSTLLFATRAMAVENTVSLNEALDFRAYSGNLEKKLMTMQTEKAILAAKVSALEGAVQELEHRNQQLSEENQQLRESRHLTKFHPTLLCPVPGISPAMATSGGFSPKPSEASVGDVASGRASPTSPHRDSPAQQSSSGRASPDFIGESWHLKEKLYLDLIERLQGEVASLNDSLACSREQALHQTQDTVGAIAQGLLDLPVLRNWSGRDSMVQTLDERLGTSLAPDPKAYPQAPPTQAKAGSPSPSAASAHAAPSRIPAPAPASDPVPRLLTPKTQPMPAPADDGAPSERLTPTPAETVQRMNTSVSPNIQAPGRSIPGADAPPQKPEGPSYVEVLDRFFKSKPKRRDSALTPSAGHLRRPGQPEPSSHGKPRARSNSISPVPSPTLLQILPPKRGSHASDAVANLSTMSSISLKSDGSAWSDLSKTTRVSIIR